MGAWRSSEQINLNKLPEVFYVKPAPLNPYKIANKETVKEVRKSPATDNIYAKLKNGSKVLVSLEKTILEFGKTDIDEELLKTVNWEWVNEAS